MLEHPGTELQLLIKEKGLTQKAFSSILGKKVSEVNELLKGKRNITIQRDYLLHQTLGTPIKYWILKQIDYDYSLLDIEESSDSPLDKEGKDEVSEYQDIQQPLSPASQSSSPSREQNSDDNFTPLGGGDAEGRGGGLHQNSHFESEGRENPSNITPMDFSLQSKGQEKPEDEVQVAPLGDGKSRKSSLPGEDLDGAVEGKEEIGNNSKDDEDLQNRAKIFRTF